MRCRAIGATIGRVHCRHGFRSAGVSPDVGWTSRPPKPMQSERDEVGGAFFFPVGQAASITNWDFAETRAGRPRDAGGTPALRSGAVAGSGSGALSSTAGRQSRPPSRVFIRLSGKIFNTLAILHRRRDYISPAGPFPQINQAAALTAERELCILAGHHFLADWALQFELASHGLATRFGRPDRNRGLR